KRASRAQLDLRTALHAVLDLSARRRQPMDCGTRLRASRLCLMSKPSAAGGDDVDYRRWRAPRAGVAVRFLLNPGRAGSCEGGLQGETAHSEVCIQFVI